MTGRTPPSDLELRDNLQKRIDGVHLGYAAGAHSHSKRYVITEKGIAEPSFIGGDAANENKGIAGTLKSKLSQLVGDHRHKAIGGSGAGAGAAEGASKPMLRNNFSLYLNNCR